MRPTDSGVRLRSPLMPSLKTPSACLSWTASLILDMFSSERRVSATAARSEREPVGPVHPPTVPILDEPHLAASGAWRRQPATVLLVPPDDDRVRCHAEHCRRVGITADLDRAAVAGLGAVDPALAVRASVAELGDVRLAAKPTLLVRNSYGDHVFSVGGKSVSFRAKRSAA